MELLTNSHAHARIQYARVLGRLVGVVAQRKLPEQVLEVVDRCRRRRAHELVPAAAELFRGQNQCLC